MRYAVNAEKGQVPQEPARQDERQRHAREYRGVRPVRAPGDVGLDENADGNVLQETRVTALRNEYAHYRLLPVSLHRLFRRTTKFLSQIVNGISIFGIVTAS